MDKTVPTLRAVDEDEAPEMPAELRVALADIVDLAREGLLAMSVGVGLAVMVEMMEEELTADIRGRDLISGLPRTIQVTTEHVREALAEPVAAIVDVVKTTLDKTPPELAADIMEDGITLTGGGALLGGFAERLSHETGMPIRVADEPLYSVVIGSGRALENIDAMRGLMSMGGDE